MLFGSPILEVAIGLALLYLLLATVCSALNELLSRPVGLRGRTLETGIANLLNDADAKTLTNALMGTPVIRSISKQSKAITIGAPDAGGAGGQDEHTFSVQIAFATKNLDSDLAFWGDDDNKGILDLAWDITCAVQNLRPASFLLPARLSSGAIQELGLDGGFICGGMLTFTGTILVGRTR